MIDLFRPFMSPEVPETVAAVLTPDSAGRVYCGEGTRVKEFETKLGLLLNASYARAPLTMSSCTSALEMALYLANIRGKEVITTPMTCTATSAAIVRAGGTIVWADVNPITGLIDPTDVAGKVHFRTAAIVAVDWGGRACDYRALRMDWGGNPQPDEESAHDYARHANRRIPIIQDAAHSLLTEYCGQSIANLGGDYVCWSFGPIKHLSCGGHGGALVVPEAQRERARLLRWYGLDRESKADFRCEQDVEEPGWKAHMTDVDAAIGLANLSYMRGVVHQHRENASYYTRALSGVDGITLAPYDSGSAYWLFDLLVDDRESFQRYMTERGIMTSRVHRRNDEHPGYQYSSGPLPGVDAFDSRHVCIPVGWWLSDEDCDYIANTIISWSRSRIAVPM